MNSPVSVTEHLAEFVVHGQPMRAPAKAWHNTKHAIIDGIACALAGSSEPSVQILLQTVKASTTGPATLIGLKERADAVTAAQINGTASHVHDYDDSSPSMGGHPTGVLLSALLGLAEIQGQGGRTLMDAYIMGLEVMAAIGRAIQPHHAERGWHPTGVIGVVGSAAACSRLLGLDVDQTRRALGIAASMASGLLINFGTMVKPLHMGQAAMNGVLAARLAQGGFTANQDVFDGAHNFLDVFGKPGYVERDGMLEGLGETWEASHRGIVLKPYPAGSLAHPGIEAMLFLVRNYRLAAQDIEHIELLVSYRMPAILFHHTPRDELQAKFSLEYCVAAALCFGKVGLAEFTSEAIAHPTVQAVMSRIRMTVDPTQSDDTALPNESVRVLVTLTNGRTLEASASYPGRRGSLARPLTTEELKEKFRECGAPVLGEERAVDAFHQLLNLGEVHSMTQLTSVLRPVS